MLTKLYAAAAAASLFVGSAGAATVVEGEVFSLFLANGFVNYTVKDLSTGGPGTVIYSYDEVAELGMRDGNEVRGFAEFDIRDFDLSEPVLLSFDLRQQGLLGLAPPLPYLGGIGLNRYPGDGEESRFDGNKGGVRFAAFETAPLAVGDVLTFDVTDLVRDYRARGRDFLGITLRPLMPEEGVGIVFGNFELRQGDLAAVPLPAAAWLFGAGAAGLAAIRRRTR